MTASIPLQPRKQQRRCKPAAKNKSKHPSQCPAAALPDGSRDPSLPQRQQLREEQHPHHHSCHHHSGAGFRPRSRPACTDSTSARRHQPQGPRAAGSPAALYSNPPATSAAPARPAAQAASEGPQSEAPAPASSMKFGKRLASEAARKWCAHYFDYKAIKKAIKDDINNHDADGANFQGALVAELRKVSQFYSDRATQLEQTLRHLQAVTLQSSGGSARQELAQLRSEVQELIKFVALNYLAVVKAIKKRNKHLKEQFGSACSSSLRALDLLGHEVFFTSPRLAALSTQAEILGARMHATAVVPVATNALAENCACASEGAPSQRGGGTATQQRMLEEYQCPICLETLHNPVVLTCAHRFCWGCLVAHCTTTRNDRLPVFKMPLDSSMASATASKANAEAAAEQAQAAEQELEQASRRSSLSVLEEIALKEEEGEAGTSFYNCPVCRKPQVLDVESLQVDQHLCSFIESLRFSLASVVHISPAPAMKPPTQAPAPSAPQQPWGVLPPQSPQHQGKLTVLLDVDGTLISSFTPRRAPRLPASVKTHVVGIGSKLNPQGVFVVERPGLRTFLQQLAAFAEVVIFTAGLEDYARPIVDALDPDNTLFAHRIYREGCVKTDYYQCVKDMARLNRSLGRTVLVDDTPLAFLHQPDNGVPVLGFRGDPDDRLLMEAVLPLLQSLDQTPDVREVLQRRFDMAAWFKRHGFPVDQVAATSLEAAEAERKVAEALGLPCGQAPTAQQLATAAAEAVAAKAAGGDTKGAAADVAMADAHAAGCCGTSSAQQLVTQAAQPSAGSAVSPAPAAPPMAPFCEWLLLCSFDRTLVDFSPVERVVEALAPELLASIVGQGPGEDAVPMLNSVLQEMQRRGVSRDQLLVTLQELGGEVPASALEFLRIAKQQAGARVTLLSDSNSVFMTHLLTGAKASALVDEVLTHPASFERAASGGGAAGAPALAAMGSGAGAAAPPSPSSVGQKLVIKPRSPATAAASGGQSCCSRCPGGLCRGSEVRALRQRGAARHFVLCGDGDADVCAALALGPEDVVLARRGGPLAAYAEGASAAAGPLSARLLLWSGHEELAALVRGTMLRP